jgi:hypothetical protein
MNEKIQSIWQSKATSLIAMYTGNGSDGSNYHRESVQSLMLLDNLHDFGHNRTSYKADMMDIFCDPSKFGTFDGGHFTCIFTIILKKLNETSFIFSDDNNDIFTYEMFKMVGWEKVFLSILLDHTNITTMPKSSWEKTFFVLHCWSQDSTKKAQKSIKTLLSENSNYKGLVTSHFDACGGTCETFSDTVASAGPHTWEFDLPFPTGNENVMYKYDPHNGVLMRKFPKKYGNGTVFSTLLKDGRECRCSSGDSTKDCIPIKPGEVLGKRRCFFRRADVLALENYPGKSDIPQDSIQELGYELYEYLDYKYPGGGTKASFKDIEFFITAKGLSDMAQCAEAKLRNCYLLTQDTMQLIIGCKLGAQMIDYGGKLGTVTVSIPTIVSYIYDIQSFLAAKGIGMPPKSALKSKAAVSEYDKKTKIVLSTPAKISSFARACVSCLFYLLYYFAKKGFYWTRRGVVFLGSRMKIIKEKED